MRKQFEQFGANQLDLLWRNSRQFNNRTVRKD